MQLIFHFGTEDRKEQQKNYPALRMNFRKSFKGRGGVIFNPKNYIRAEMKFTSSKDCLLDKWWVYRILLETLSTETPKNHL